MDLPVMLNGSAGCKYVHHDVQRWGLNFKNAFSPQPSVKMLNHLLVYEKVSYLHNSGSLWPVVWNDTWKLYLFALSVCRLSDYFILRYRVLRNDLGSEQFSKHSWRFRWFYVWNTPVTHRFSHRFMSSLDVLLREVESDWHVLEIKHSWKLTWKRITKYIEDVFYIVFWSRAKLCSKKKKNTNLFAFCYCVVFGAPYKVFGTIGLRGWVIAGGLVRN